MSSKPMVYVQTGSYCEPCLYFASCPVHDPDGSIWRATHKGMPYFDDNGVQRIA